MNNKFLNKVVGQILSETKLDYGVWKFPLKKENLS